MSLVESGQLLCCKYLNTLNEKCTCLNGCFATNLGYAFTFDEVQMPFAYSISNGLLLHLFLKVSVKICRPPQYNSRTCREYHRSIFVVSIF